MPPSKRRYAFNAIFSRSTNRRREHLANVIESQHGMSNLPIFTTMAKQWSTFYADDQQTEQLNTDDYVKVLLDSVFTLAPAGGSPECFRMFEAVEAGSIPIFAKHDIDTTARKCKGSLDHWLDAPVVILEVWDDLFPTVEKLMGDLRALDEMQVKLQQWYVDYMRRAVGGLEDFLVESNVKTSA